MNDDMTAICGEGLINIRVGAIIVRDGAVLMVGNRQCDYLYSVGGRIKFSETAREAVIREVYEETGVKMDIDRLGFVNEVYFIGDSPVNLGKTIYEICFYFYMKVPPDFSPCTGSVTDYNAKEYLEWVPLSSDRKIYPDFFKTELLNPKNTVKHFLTDER